MAHRFTIAAGFDNIMLTDGRMYDGGDTATLTDDQWARLSASFIEKVVRNHVEIREGGGTGGGTEDPLSPSIFVVARKTANQAIPATATNINDLAWALEANSTYLVHIVLVQSAVTGSSPTLTLSFTGPGSPTLVSLRRYQMTSATAVATTVITSFTAFANGAAVANTLHTIEGVIVTGANAGTLQLRGQAGGTGSPTVTIAAGSGGHIEKIS